MNNTALDVLYQDEVLIAVTKPNGLLVHPGKEPEAKEWIAMKVLRDQIGRRVYAIHRLDRPTSGVLLFALEEPAADAMRAEFESRRVQKSYVAVVRGETPEAWENRTPLQKEEGAKMKECHTRFQRLGCDPSADTSTVLAEPLTGRHHQIRRHLAGDGFPILGDYLYGDTADNDRLAATSGLSRMLLHARSLSFTHPVTRQPVLIESPLPPEFGAFCGFGEHPHLFPA